MSSVVCVGGQWGEEAKGKVFSHLSTSADYVVRFEGSHLGAQHVSFDGVSVRLQLLPSGILNNTSTAVIGDGVLVDLEVLYQEMEMLQAHGVGLTENRLVISPEANLILPFHKKLEKARSGGLRMNGKAYLTRGASVAAEDRASNMGVCMGDLQDSTRLADKIRDGSIRANARIAALGGDVMTGEEIQASIARHIQLGESFLKHILPIDDILAGGLKDNAKVIFEGSGGTFRDQDFGELDDIDMSSHKAGLASSVTGVGPAAIEHVLLVAKAYTTRSGRGAMPGELDADLSAPIVQRGDEVIQSTGQPRRISWLDLVQLKKAARIHGATCVALTKLDVLSGLPEIGVISDYEPATFPRRADHLAAVQTSIQTFAGFERSENLSANEELWPQGLKDFVSTIESQLELPVVFLSFSSAERGVIARGELGEKLFSARS